MNPSHHRTPLETHHQPEHTMEDTTIQENTISALTPPVYGEYWPGQGGFYGGTQPAMHGLPARHLVFPEAEHLGLAYGPYGTHIEGADSRVDGRANTAALLASGHDCPAAKWAAEVTADGHHDFHLPSQADLFMASLCAPERFNKDGWYWSSTQYSAFIAFGQAFEDGGSLWTSKVSKFRVRAVRWIQAL